MDTDTDFSSSDENDSQYSFNHMMEEEVASEEESYSEHNVHDGGLVLPYLYEPEIASEGDQHDNSENETPDDNLTDRLENTDW